MKVKITKILTIISEQLKYETKMNEKLVNERNELKSISEKNIALLEEKLKLYEQEKQKHDTSLKQTLSELSNIKKVIPIFNLIVLGKGSIGTKIEKS